MVTSMVGWIFSFIEESSYNSRAIWFQYHDHHGDNSDDESYPPSQNRQIRRFANHSATYMTYSFSVRVATRRNYNTGSLQKLDISISSIVIEICHWKSLLGSFVFSLLISFRFSFLVSFRFSFLVPFWFSFLIIHWIFLQNDDLNNFEGSRFGTDLVPDFGPSDYLLRFSEIYISFPIVIESFFCQI